MKIVKPHIVIHLEIHRDFPWLLKMKIGNKLNLHVLAVIKINSKFKYLKYLFERFFYFVITSIKKCNGISL